MSSIYDNNLQNSYVEGMLKTLQAQMDELNVENFYTKTATDILLELKVDKDFSEVTNKITPIDDDYLLINDSEDEGKLKKVKKSSLGGGGGGGAYEVVTTGTVTNGTLEQVIVDSTLLTNGEYTLILSNINLNYPGTTIAFKRTDGIVEHATKILRAGSSPLTTHPFSKDGMFIFNETHGGTSKSNNRIEMSIGTNFAVMQSSWFEESIYSSARYMQQTVLVNNSDRRNLIVNRAFTGSYDYKLVRLN